MMHYLNRTLYSYCISSWGGISYCISSWGGVAKNKLQCLFVLQNRCVRLLFGKEKAMTIQNIMIPMQEPDHINNICLLEIANWKIQNQFLMNKVY